MSINFRDIRGPEDSKQGNFSSMCSRLIMRIAPAARPVDGSGGDDGVDTYIGTFNGLCQVFQHKYFIERIGGAQRGQIRRSLVTATENHTVTDWTLLLPVDLSPAEIRWFDALRPQFPATNLDWWGKTKLQQLLDDHPDIARHFEPEPSIIAIFAHSPSTRADSSVADLRRAIASELTPGSEFEVNNDVLEAMMRNIFKRSRLKLLIWGPGPGADLYIKRCEIRDRLCALGHEAHFSEDVWTPERFRLSGLNLKVGEFLQAQSYDYIVCLMASPGSIGEVHDFANDRRLASRMMICVDKAHQDGYSASGALRIFEGYNGKLSWFDNPVDVKECYLMGRVIEHVNKVAEGRQYVMATAWGPE